MPDERVTQEQLDAQTAKVADLRVKSDPKAQEEYEVLHQMRKRSIGEAVIAGERPHTDILIGGDAVLDR